MAYFLAQSPSSSVSNALESASGLDVGFRLPGTFQFPP